MTMSPMRRRFSLLLAPRCGDMKTLGALRSGQSAAGGSLNYTSVP